MFTDLLMRQSVILGSSCDTHPVHYLRQVLFACAEALYAHGYSNEACRLAVDLAMDLLANPPDLKVEQPQTKVSGSLAPDVRRSASPTCWAL